MAVPDMTCCMGTAVAIRFTATRIMTGYMAPAAGITVRLATSSAQNTGGAGVDYLAGFENLLGSAFNDTLLGDGNANVMEGGAGDDIISAGAGIDTLAYAHAAAGVTVSLSITTAQNTIGAGTDTATGFEYIIGSAFNDTLTGNTGANIIDGGAGDDVMNGSYGIDTVTYAAAASGVTVNLALTTAQNTGGGGVDTLSAFENVTGSTFNDVLTG